MKDKDAENQIVPLQRENETLSQQVKRLIKAESQLYRYQEELDTQLKEYKDLYELNRKLNATFQIGNICEYAVAYAVRNLEFERAVLFRRVETTGEYHVCAFEGYYAEQEKTRIAKLTIEQDAPFLSPLTEGTEFLVCTADSKEKELLTYRTELLLNEYFIYPLGTRSHPHAFIAVGNSMESAEFYRRVSCSPGTLLSMGNFVGVVSSSIENHTFYDRMQKALEQKRLAEAKYRAIFENAVEGIFQRTPRGQYLDVNPSLARILGYASPQELMTSVTDIGQQLYVEPERQRELVRLVEENGLVERFETRMYRKDGTAIWASINARVVREGTGEVLYYEGSAEDITERKRAEEALRESEQKYRQLSEALEQRVKEEVDESRRKDEILIIQSRLAVIGEMISNIAHQWRQPLNILGLLAQDLEMRMEMDDFSKEIINANVQKSVEIIQQLSETIDDFRHFFKPDKEKLRFRVLETVDNTISLLNGSLKASRIKIELTATGDPEVNGYPGQFTQALLNILINAREALVKRKVGDPMISIRLFAEGSKTVVTITDNAGGIPEEIIDKIFEPYFTTKGPEYGTGIGLFMCRTIIQKNMGGTLKARNVGDGAEFRIEV